MLHMHIYMIWCILHPWDCVCHADKCTFPCRWGILYPIHLSRSFHLWPSICSYYWSVFLLHTRHLGFLRFPNLEQLNSNILDIINWNKFNLISNTILIILRIVVYWIEFDFGKNYLTHFLSILWGYWPELEYLYWPIAGSSSDTLDRRHPKSLHQGKQECKDCLQHHDQTIPDNRL